MSSTIVHVVTNGRISFFLQAEYHNLFIHPSLDRYVLILAVVNNAAMSNRGFPPACPQDTEHARDALGGVLASHCKMGSTVPSSSVPGASVGFRD